MAVSSKFVQLHQQVLCEYQYADQADPETHETDDNVSDDWPIELMQNGYTNTKFLFNPDSKKLLSGNVRDRSVVPLDTQRNRWAFLDIDIPLVYNDYDNNLTNTVDLEQDFTPDLEIKYDRIRFHLQSGFDFDDFDGFIFEVRATRRDSAFVNLASLLYRKPDSYQTLNPNPLLIGNRLYTSYIEIVVPALFYLNDELINNPTNSNLLGYKLTDGLGFVKTSGIQIRINGIRKTEKINGFTYFDATEVNSVTLGKKDEFDLLIAKIEDSPAGDYFEFYGEYNGDIFEDFINQLNNQPNSDYLAFHEIIVSEQISTNFLETSRQTMIQSSNFGEVMRFRPIILNSATAVSFSIEYILRLINRIDNSQIIKRSQLISRDVKKYGRNLTQLHMGRVPTIVNVYNTLPDDSGAGLTINSPVFMNTAPSNSQATSSTPIVTKTEFVTMFRDRINIKVSTSAININDLNITT